MSEKGNVICKKFKFCSNYIHKMWMCRSANVISSKLQILSADVTGADV